MHLLTNKTLFLVLLLLFFPWGCRTPPAEMPSMPVIEKTFNQGYDEVWEALEKIMVDEQRLPIKTKNRQKGVIQTDWVSVIRIRGTLRWYLKVILDKKGNQTAVRVYNRVEEPSNPKEALGKFKNKKGEIKTGWTLSTEKIAEVDGILDTLSLKLGE